MGRAVARPVEDVMSPVPIAILSLSMSADAFAAAIGRGAARRPSVASAVRSGIVFGVIEGVTPLIGWAIGIATSAYVASVDHWIAFVLLAAVGGKMIWEAIRRDGERNETAPEGNGVWSLIFTAVGTSIDAAAVGVSLALLDVPILVVAASIGLSTFVMATIGLLIGRAVGGRFGAIAELLGGIALVLIGTGILLEHLGYLPG